MEAARLLYRIPIWHAPGTMSESSLQSTAGQHQDYRVKRRNNDVGQHCLQLGGTRGTTAAPDPTSGCAPVLFTHTHTPTLAAVRPKPPRTHMQPHLLYCTRTWLGPPAS